MLLPVLCRLALLVSLVVPLMQAADTYPPQPREDYGYTVWCNNKRATCLDCNDKEHACLVGGVDSNGKCIDEGTSRRGSAISNESFEHYHIAHDYAPRPKGASAAGCAPCGSTGSEESSAALPELEVTRIHRQRVAYLPSSFGPGCFQAYDTAMWLERGSMPGGWIAQVQDISAGAAEISWWEISPTDGDAAVDGVFWDTYHQKAGALRLQAADRTPVIDPAAARYAVLTRHDGWTFTFELFNQGDSEAYQRREGRLVRFADRNGQGIDLAYVYPVTATTVELDGSRPRLRQLDRVTDAYGRQSIYHYLPTQVAGRWVVSGIDLPNGTSLAYGYANGLLASVSYPDGTQATFDRTQSGNYDAVTFDDPGADGAHRRKIGFYSRSVWINPADPADVRGQIAGQIRELRNADGERVWFSRQDLVDPGSRYVYEGGAKMVRLDHTDIDHPLATNFVKNWVLGESTVGKPIEVSKSYELDGFKLATITDALGRKERFTRDPRTRLVVRTDYPDDTFSTTLLNAFAQPLREVDRLGRITDSIFDLRGNRLSKTEAVGSADAATWSWEYNARGQAIAVHDALYNPATPDLHLTTFAYDAIGQLISRTDAADVAGGPRAVTSFTYDAAGRLATTTDASGRVVTFAYDVRNRLVTTTFTDNSTETATFGTGITANLVVARTDRNGNQTTFAYDLTGREITRVVAATAPGSASTTTTDYLTGTTLPSRVVSNGETRTYAYDHRNRRVSASVQPKAGTTLTATSTYDAANQLVATVDWYGRSTFRGYDVNGRLIRTVMELVPGGVPTGSDPATLPRSLTLNPAYVITEQTYDAEGQMLASIDGRGIRHTFTYDAQGRTVAQVAAEARETAPGVFTVLPTPEAARTLIQYDAQGNRTAVTLPRSYVRLGDGTWVNGSDGMFRTTSTYTGRNLQATQTVADALSAGGAVRPERATTAFTYTPTGNLATATDARSFLTSYFYLPCCDRLGSIIDPSGAITNLSYDFHGNRTSMTDGNGNTTTWTYDARHRVQTQTNGAGETTTYAYDDNLTDGVGVDALYAAQIGDLGLVAGLADGSAVAMTNPAGETSVQIADGLGRTVRTIDGNGNISSMQYDSEVAGLVETVQIDGVGSITRARADGAGRMRSAFDAENNATTQAFDANGNRVSIRDPSGTGMDCTFDARDRDIFCTDTRGDVLVERETTYDSHGNVVRQTDPLDKDDVCVFDARDRKISCTDRVNATTLFAYDDENNLVQIVDAEGGVTDYAYDNRNLLVTEKFPADTAQSEKRTVRSYAYDAGRRLTDRLVTTEPASTFSELTQYAYDHANRLLARGYADGLNDGFQYDLASRLTQATSDRYRVDVTRAYDPGSRLTTETQTYRDGKQSGNTISAQAYSVIYGYDAANRTTTLTYPDGATVTRAYTDRNQLQQVQHKLAGSGSFATIATRLYDEAGKLGTTTYGNSLVESRSYLPDSNLVATIAIPGVTAFTYSYDANGRKTQESNSILSQDTQVFGYDDQDRLTLWTRPNVSDVQEWTLSAVGDWLTSTRVGVTETRTHSAVHELTGRTVGTNPTIPLSYDAKGNLTDDGEGRVYVWDPENRLTQANVTGSASPTGFGLVASYQYDALGRRVAKTWGGKTTRYLCAGAQVVEERDSTPIPSQASLTGADKDGSLANASLTPATGGILPAGSNGPVQRVNFQPPTEAAPAGYLKDAGSVYSVRSNGQSYGWNLGVSGTSRVRRGAVPIPELDTLIHMQKGGPTKKWEYALPNGSYPIIVVAGDPSHRDQTNNLSIEGIQVIDPDPSAPQGYEKGDFDGYAVQVTITDGRLTIQPGSGAVNAKICYVEIGAQGTTIDQATKDRLAALIEQATTQTAATVQSTTAKRQYVFGSYVDELVSYTVGTTRYYVHANHLYSPSAITNASGVVVERMRYDAYGKQTITTATGTTRNQSAVGFSRGFTGYILDEETGLYYARARMYSPGLGRFVSRDPLRKTYRHPNSWDGYQNGLSLYFAYFTPNFVDPYGLAVIHTEQIKDGAGKVCGVVTVDRATSGRMTYKFDDSARDKLCGCCAGSDFGWIQHESVNPDGSIDEDGTRYPAIWRYDSASQFEVPLGSRGRGDMSDPDAARQPGEGDRPLAGNGQPTQSNGPDRWRGNPWYGGGGNVNNGTNDWNGDGTVDRRDGDAFARNPQPQEEISDLPGGAETFVSQLICAAGGGPFFSWRWSAKDPGHKGTK